MSGAVPRHPFTCQRKLGLRCCIEVRAARLRGALLASPCLLSHPTPSHTTRPDPPLPQEWGITRLCYEYDTEPYAKVRDAAVDQLARQAGVEVQAPVGHTLYVGL